MAERNRVYRKLPGVAVSLVGRTRLWVAEDHLLLVSSVAAFENYRRFYFREIKALIVQPTSFALIWSVVCGLLFILFGLGAYALWVARFGMASFGTQPVMVGVVVLGAASVLAGLLLVINLARGKSCRFFVQTSAGVERLGAPARLGAARRVRAILAVKILAAQAEDATPAGSAATEARADAITP